MPIVKEDKEYLLKDLELLKDNARIHSKYNIESIAKSLELYDQHAPLVVQDSTKTIIIGNGRYEAMLSLGWEKGWVVFVDDSDSIAIARSLADNKVAELAEWDYKIIDSIIKENDFDIEDIPGFEQIDYEKIDVKQSREYRDNEEFINGYDGENIYFIIGKFGEFINKKLILKVTNRIDEVIRGKNLTNRQILENILTHILKQWNL